MLTNSILALDPPVSRPASREPSAWASAPLAGLLFRGPCEARAGLRRALIGQAQRPWRHFLAREEDLRLLSQPLDVLVLERDDQDGIDAVTLVLLENHHGYEVASLAHRHRKPFCPARYRRALQDFMANVAIPAARGAGFTLEGLTPLRVV